MNEAERRQRVEDICDAALQRAEGDRAAFVAIACDGDEGLRQEVEALLSHAQRADTFLTASISEVAADILTDHSASLVGRQFGVYQILSLIGAGGMGEVYRARDTKLRRDVAIKVLPQAFTHDPDRLARFKREAQILASLNHSNIAAIYGLEACDGVEALVLELVEGPTLADRIARGPIPLEEALPIAKQIVEALEAAHEREIIHRDLKPANIKVRDDGTVKVLDFGLAKAMEPLGAASPNVSQSPTITTPAMTQAGIILGTAAYMSPEQAKGQLVDRRADVWAFGAVLFEMLTGRPPFEADGVAETLAAILRAAPDWSVLPAATPPAIRRLLRRCLERDVRARISDMAMVRIELRDAEGETAAASTGALVVSRERPSVIPRVVRYAAAIVLALATGLTMWRMSRSAELPRPLVRFSIDLPAGTELTPNRTAVAISPDGTHLVYVANQRMYLRALDQATAIPIADTEKGGIAGHARAPSFSPDGQWIAFWQAGELRRMAVSGGAPLKICDAQDPSGAIFWGADDEILFGSGLSGILKVRVTGGTPDVLIEAKDGERAGSPSMLPGGEWILFVMYRLDPEQGRVVVQSRFTGERRTLIEAARYARYLPTGHILYGRGNALLARAFNPRRATLSAGPVLLLEDVANTGTVVGMHVAVSSTGILLYVTGSVSATTSLTRLVLVARNGDRSSQTDVGGMTWFPRFSPEGSRVAYAVSAGSNSLDASDLWVLDLVRGARTRVTFGGNNRFYPIWTHDGTRLTFADGPSVVNRLVSALADGSGGLRTLDVGPRRYPTSWSPDGHVLALQAVSPNNTRDIWMLHVDGDKVRAEPFVTTPFEDRGAIFSPDGRWVAYVSNKSGRNDIYAQPYPGPGREIMISVGGGREPVWAPSGRELFYRHDGKLVAVRIEERASSLVVSAPARVFDDPYKLDASASDGGIANYDTSPDGTHFVMVEVPQPTGVDSTESPQLQVVLNWLEEVKQRVPTK